MHLYLMTRGILRQVEEQASILQAQRFPFKRTNLNICKCGAMKDIHGTEKTQCPKFEGKEEVTSVQGSLRPIQIWEYVFPETSLNDVMGGLQITGPITRPELKSVAWMLRKGLKLDQIPEIKGIPLTGYNPLMTMNEKPCPPAAVHQMNVPGVAVYPVGIRKDPIQDYDWGKEGKYNQEGL